MDPGELIRVVRERNGLSQAELSRRAKVVPPVVSAYETHRRDPSIGTLRRILAAAGEVLELSSHPPRGDLPPIAGPEEHGRRLVEVLLLADAVPRTRRGPLVAPRLTSR